MKILELGTGLLPAYAGKILVDQGFTVTKLTEGNDPILSLHNGARLWDWIHQGKKVLTQPIYELAPIRAVDVVFDTFSREQFAQWHIDPARLADRWSCLWVSMPPGDPLSLRSELGFVRGGLYLAFRIVAASAQQRGRHILITSEHADTMYRPDLAYTQYAKDLISV